MASSLHCEEQLEAVTSELITTFSFVDDANGTAGLEERVEALRDVEVLYKVEDYASRQQQATVSTSWRRRIVEWLYQVADAYHLSRETVGIAMNFLDRYLSTTACNKKFFQLASMCALFLAAKIQEARPVRMHDLIKLSRGVFKNTDLKSMEKAMLRHLKWHLHPPTPPSFVRLFLHYLPEDDQNDQDKARSGSGSGSSRSRIALGSVLELSEWNCELSVCEYFFVKFPPSTVAVSAILNAIEKSPTPPSKSAVDKFVANLNNVLKIKTDTEEVNSCREALMKMYNASGIEEDLQSDIEVATVNAAATNGKNGKRDMSSPTSVADSIVGAGSSSATRNATRKKNEEEEEDELDSEVAGINAGYMNGNRPPSRSASRCSNGRVSANSWVGVTSEAALSSSSGEVKINVGSSNNFKVTVRSRPNSVCSGAIISTESHITSLDKASARLKSSSRDRRASFDAVGASSRYGKKPRDSRDTTSPHPRARSQTPVLSRSFSTELSGYIAKTSIREAVEEVKEELKEEMQELQKKAQEGMGGMSSSF